MICQIAKSPGCGNRRGFIWPVRRHGVAVPLTSGWPPASHMQIVPPEQLELFASARLPHRPYCSEDLEYGVKIRPLTTALQLPYLQLNPPHLRFWMVFDIDRPGAALAWEDANLPRPAWAAVNRENGRAHLAYALSAPVLVAENARREPIRFLQGIEGAYRHALAADQGYSGLITKNPTHARWHTVYGLQRLWELGELAEYGNVHQYIPKYAKKPEEYGLGRNCILFDFVRRWAYRNVRAAKQKGNFVLWQADCNARGLARNGDFMKPLDGREVWHIAKSVATWVWRHFDIAKSDQRFSERQAKRGAKGGMASGIVRAQASENKSATARLMRAKGMSVRKIAAELCEPKSTVHRWIAEP